jgi:hypothetical protein
MKKLTDTQLIVLSAAAQRSTMLALPLPKNLKGGAAQKVVSPLIEHGLLAEIDADMRIGEDIWRKTGDGHGVTLAITERGLAAIGLGSDDEALEVDHPDDTRLAPDSSREPQAGEDSAMTAEADAEPDTGAQGATGANAEDAGDTAAASSQDAPTAATAPKVHKTRDGSKQAALIDMLRRPEGATIDEIVTAFGWQPHTVRGAIAGALKKKLGLEVTSHKDEKRGRVYRVAG